MSVARGIGSDSPGSLVEGPGGDRDRAAVVDCHGHVGRKSRVADRVSGLCGEQVGTIADGGGVPVECVGRRCVLRTEGNPIEEELNARDG